MDQFKNDLQNLEVANFQAGQMSYWDQQVPQYVDPSRLCVGVGFCTGFCSGGGFCFFCSGFCSGGFCRCSGFCGGHCVGFCGGHCRCGGGRCGSPR